MVFSRSTEIILMLVGIGYGTTLILSTFMSNRLIDLVRLDTFFTRKSTQNGKKLNLVIGLLVLGNCLYSLFR